MDNKFEQLSYKNRLSEHLDKYLEVVLSSPEVRVNEFKELMKFSQLSNPRTILEVPAEIGMLEQVCSYTQIDRADWLKINLQNYGDQIPTTDFSFSGIKSNYYDAVLAIVPFHHASPDEKSQYISGAMRSLRQGGKLSFGEVEQGSKEHYFLDEFIHQHTPTGHRGMYVTHGFNEILVQQGFKDVASETKSCPWVFNSTTAMLEFIADLFNLQAISEKDLLKGLNRYLGIKEDNGKLYLNWNLCYFRGIKPRKIDLQENIN